MISLHANLVLFRWILFVVLLGVVLLGRFSSQCAKPREADSADESIVREALEFIGTLDCVDLPEGGEWTFCTRVVDGDTIVIENDERVRYIGIDTPETVHPRIGVEPFGPEASAVNKALVEGRRVYLVSDITNRDKYGRLLRYVYTEDGLFVNLALVACGLATVTTYPPDVAHVEEYVTAQEEAREAGRGIWGEDINVNESSPSGEEGQENE
jgi:micrococcal nuclease